LAQSRALNANQQDEKYKGVKKNTKLAKLIMKDKDVDGIDLLEKEM